MPEVDFWPPDIHICTPYSHIHATKYAHTLLQELAFQTVKEQPKFPELILRLMTKGFECEMQDSWMEVLEISEQ